MPIIVTKYTYSIIPQKAPFIIRPILKTVFQKIEKLVYDPDLKKNVEYVGFSKLFFALDAPLSCCH